MAKHKQTIRQAIEDARVASGVPPAEFPLPPDMPQAPVPLPSMPLLPFADPDELVDGTSGRLVIPQEVRELLEVASLDYLIWLVENTALGDLPADMAEPLSLACKAGMRRGFTLAVCRYLAALKELPAVKAQEAAGRKRGTETTKAKADEKRALVRALLDEYAQAGRDLDVEAIAKQAGRSTDTVYRYIRELNGGR
jgi:bifunctional DNA-binding transcriptional regulator/antitoxin component of YhaV-PrlF toxin-antitoxin module